MIAGVALGKREFRGVGGISILDAQMFRRGLIAPHHTFRKYSTQGTRPPGLRLSWG